MAQNIYDDPAFFEGYSQFPRSREGLAGAPEWPSLQAMLPDVAGLRVLDLGCGLGYFCEWAAMHGAADVLGLDLSEKMLEAAAQRCVGLPVRLERADLDTVKLPKGRFNLVYSSLAVHYVADFDALCRKVRHALKANGWFVFSMEHPVFAARADPEWATDAAGGRVAAVKDYLREGKRTINWIADGVVKYHRLISSTVTALLSAGFRLEAIEEWVATDEQALALAQANPEWAAERYEPMFLLIAASADRHA